MCGMSNDSWHVSGDYFEACSCDFLCPCMSSNLTATPTQGFCDVGLVFHINEGRAGDVSLDDLNFVVVASTPGVMGEGNWKVGVIIDERATEQQAQALTGIASGQAGGPMANLGPLLGEFAGVERRPIEFNKDGLSRSVSVPGMIEQVIEGVPSPVVEGDVLYLDNTVHPANPRIGLATAERTSIHAFGIDWDDSSGKTNGHLAPFDWSG
jgi:hypothetical protein